MARIVGSPIWNIAVRDLNGQRNGGVIDVGRPWPLDSDGDGRVTKNDRVTRFVDPMHNPPSITVVVNTRVDWLLKQAEKAHIRTLNPNGLTRLYMKLYDTNHNLRLEPREHRRYQRDVIGHPAIMVSPRSHG
jgi:hypothetical protein